jgi:hypothetical protein
MIWLLPVGIRQSVMRNRQSTIGNRQFFDEAAGEGIN